MNVRVLNAAEVRAALPMAAAIEAMKQAYRLLSLGQADVPLRSRIEITAQSATSLVMPAFVAESGSMAVKIVNVFPKNPDRHLPTLHALVVVLDPETGELRALLEGSSLTAIRTGAGSGAATDLLARSDCRVMTLFGTGEQARTQLEAVCTVRPLSRVWVVGRDRARAESFARSMASQGPIPADVRVSDDPARAVREADIISTATTSATPVLFGRDLSPGVHVNAIGGFTPQMQEVDAATVQRARVFVDSRLAAMAEAGDLIEPIRRGSVPPDWTPDEIGDLVAGRIPGRRSKTEITLFKSVGIAVQDAVAASLALQRAEAVGLGTVLFL
jgi:ornithine cyclodeaminase